MCSDLRVISGVYFRGKNQLYIILIVSHSNEGNKAAHRCQCQTHCGNSKINQNDISNFFHFLIRPKHHGTFGKPISKTRYPHHSQLASTIFLSRSWGPSLWHKYFSPLVFTSSMIWHAHLWSWSSPITENNSYYFKIKWAWGHMALEYVCTFYQRDLWIKKE